MMVLCSVNACLHVLVGHHALVVTIFGTTHCTLVPVEWQGGHTMQAATFAWWMQLSMLTKLPRATTSALMELTSRNWRASVPAANQAFGGK
jgi:hypothetical protein